MLQTVSGSHFNPSVTLAFWRTGEIGARRTIWYGLAQVAGGVSGVVVAHLSFDASALTVSDAARSGSGLVLAEGVAIFVLLLVILALTRTGRSSQVPAAVGAWVAAIVFATSSTGFANPAVTIARVFTDTYIGIAPGSVVGFLIAQVAAGVFAARVARMFSPDPVSSPTK